MAAAAAQTYVEYVTSEIERHAGENTALMTALKQRFQKLLEAQADNLEELKVAWLWRPAKEFPGNQAWLDGIMPKAKAKYRAHARNLAIVVDAEEKFPTGPDGYRRHEIRGINNIDGSCAIVAAFHVYRKTALWPYINDQLHFTIMQAISDGKYRGDGDGFERLPEEINTIYTTKLSDSGGTVGERIDGDGNVSNLVMDAIALGSPELKTRTKLKDLIEWNNAVWANKRNFYVWIEESCRIDSKEQFVFFHANCQDNWKPWTDMVSDPKRTDAALDLQMQAASSQLSNLITALDTHTGITGGIIRLRWPGRVSGSSYHAVAFVKDKGAMHLFNWGKRKTGIKLLTESVADQCMFFTGKKEAFCMYGLTFVFEQEKCPLDLVWDASNPPDAAALKRMEVIVIALLWKECDYKSTLGGLNKNDTKLLQWFLCACDEFEANDPIVKLPFNEHWLQPPKDLGEISSEFTEIANKVLADASANPITWLPSSASIRNLLEDVAWIGQAATEETYKEYVLNKIADHAGDNAILLAKLKKAFENVLLLKTDNLGALASAWDNGTYSVLQQIGHRVWLRGIRKPGDYFSLAGYLDSMSKENLSVFHWFLANVTDDVVATLPAELKLRAGGEYFRPHRGLASILPQFTESDVLQRFLAAPWDATFAVFLLTYGGGLRTTPRRGGMVRFRPDSESESDSEPDVPEVVNEQKRRRTLVDVKVEPSDHNLGFADWTF